MIDTLLSKNLVPDFAIRLGIRRLLAQRIREVTTGPHSDAEASGQAFARALSTMPVAINTSESKEQHYEVPTEFYQHVLGPHLKYSCCWFETGEESLGEAEEAMFRIYEERAALKDGQDVLELGCGWGSLSLWLALRHPRSRFTGVSHSRTQKLHIDAEARRLGLTNLTIITCDMNEVAFDASRFDRVVSVEMFEHMKNWPLLFSRISSWLRPGGRFFMHVFTHRTHSYHFEARDESDWMSRYFFTGGMMPSDDLATRFQEHLHLAKHWRVNGLHYSRTAECWLDNMDANRERIMPLLANCYGAANAERWWSYWRVFFMSCAELWGYRKGEEWLVSHYALDKPVLN